MLVRLLCAALIASGSSALGQDLIGSTFPSGGLSTIVVINPATGATRPYMTVPVPSGFQLYQIGGMPDCRLAGTIYRGDTSTNAARLCIIDGAAGTSTIRTFTSPLDNSYAEGLDWSPRHNALLVSFTQFGSFGTTRLALVNPDGVVQATTNALSGADDFDTILSSPTQDIFFNLNHTTSNRVLQLTALFPNPAVAGYATPPSLASWYDGTIHPTTGEILFSDSEDRKSVV